VGEALIGVDPATRKRLDYSVALAWERDHWFMRTMRTSIDAEDLIGAIGRHPLAPPIDYDRLERFEAMQTKRLMMSPLKHCPFDALVALEQCSRTHYVRIKRDTDNMMGHAQKLHCTTCHMLVLKDAMQCCTQCKFPMHICKNPDCFKVYWTRTHKAV
jgi:hypothetical protein